MSYLCHVPPVRFDLERNRDAEPEGERLRAELEDWLERNGIVSIMLDTQNHQVRVDIAKLPQRTKSVLTLWGAIRVNRDHADAAALPAVKRHRNIRLPVEVSQ